MVIICKYCKKEYSSYSSRSNHIKKFHTIETSTIHPKAHNQHIIAQKSTQNEQTVCKDIENNINMCKYCKTNFTRSYSLKRHYLKCRYKEQSENKLKEENEMLKEQMKEQQKLFELQLENLKKEMIQMMNKNCKIHPKTLNKINKQLNTNNTYNDNKVINNINLIALGKEEIPDVFTRKEKLKILNTNMLALDTIVKDVHFNEKYPQFNNVLITNTQNSIGYKYNEDEKKFVAVEKSELIHEIINARMGDIVFFQEELENDIKPIVNERILKLINKMDNDKKYMENKHKDIKLIIYNNKEMIEKIRENLPLLEDVDNPLHSSNIIIV
jgi:hypothetical protein